MPEHASLGQYKQEVQKTLEKLDAEDVVERIWRKDHTVWKPEPEEIANRLGWLSSPRIDESDLNHVASLPGKLRKEGLTHALLLGMGGSSLAPELFSLTFKPAAADAALSLGVLDSTDPDAVRSWQKRLPIRKTVFIVSTKSGTTVETLSFFKYFYNLCLKELGEAEAGKRFIAITDPGSKLEKLGKELGFREIFLNDPEIGGRYSALSYFGLVPAAIAGVEVKRLVESARLAAEDARTAASQGTNPGLWLGAALGTLAREGRDKATIITSPAVRSFGDWAEQLIAESTGKEGKGILPVVGEPLLSPENYGGDRFFIYIKSEGESEYDQGVDALEAAGHPVARFRLLDIYDLGAQFFIWEMATVTAGHLLGINPFDQPNVESAKKAAKRMVEQYRQSGTFPEQEAALEAEGVRVYGEVKAEKPDEALDAFLDSASPGDYISIQAYLPPSAETDRLLEKLRTGLMRQLHLATTVGYGPRFLHSTGQLHKGDRGGGLFIQLTSEAEEDLRIPDEPGDEKSSMSFGVLKQAQAIGDGEALKEGGRRVIRFHLGNKPEEKLGLFL